MPMFNMGRASTSGLLLSAMGIVTRHARMQKTHISLLLVFMIVRLSAADLPNGNWKISGEISDVAMSASQGSVFTNTFSLAGYYHDGHFLVDLTPIKSLDDGTES